MLSALNKRSESTDNTQKLALWALHSHGFPAKTFPFWIPTMAKIPRLLTVLQLKYDDLLIFVQSFCTVGVLCSVYMARDSLDQSFSGCSAFSFVFVCLGIANYPMTKTFYLYLFYLFIYFWKKMFYLVEEIAWHISSISIRCLPFSFLSTVDGGTHTSHQLSVLCASTGSTQKPHFHK